MLYVIIQKLHAKTVDEEDSTHSGTLQNCPFFLKWRQKLTENTRLPVSRGWSLMQSQKAQQLSEAVDEEKFRGCNPVVVAFDSFLWKAWFSATKPPSCKFKRDENDSNRLPFFCGCQHILICDRHLVLSQTQLQLLQVNSATGIPIYQCNLLYHDKLKRHTVIKPSFWPASTQPEE